MSEAISEMAYVETFVSDASQDYEYWRLPYSVFLFFKISSDPTTQKLVFQDIVKVLSFFSQVQEQTAVWQLLSSLPDVFQNDTSVGNLFDVLRKANRWDSVRTEWDIIVHRGFFVCKYFL